MAAIKKKTSSILDDIKKRKTKCSYEITFILQPGLSEKARNEQLDSIRGILTMNDGKIIFEDLTWGERLMMYPIKGYDNGYYGVLIFETEVENLLSIDAKLKLEEALLRSLIITIPVKGYKQVKYKDIKDHYDIIS